MRRESLAVMISPVVLFLLGFIIGVLTGFFGVGGGFLVTPTLNIFGWMAGLIILAGAIIGVYCGVYATEYATGMKIKILFALLLFVVAASVFLKQINMVTTSMYLVVGSACTLSLVILLPLGKRIWARY